MPKSTKEEKFRWIKPILDMEYNNLEHCGLNGLTPNEMLQLLTTNEPTNVHG